ncbi:MAG: hypothetical protein ABI867_08015 [Kofleriaceae bacterium]
MTALEPVQHVLAVAVRVTDHFLGTAVPDELDVRLDATELPGLTRGGNGRRHTDGTYRFVDIDGGPHTLTVTSPDGRWMALEPIATLWLPAAQPTHALVIEMWPAPSQNAPLGMPALRGKLVGTTAATIDQRIEVDVGPDATGHYTRTTSRAEFLFPLPGRLALDAAGNVPITVRVIGQTITGGELVAGELRTPFIGSAFAIHPGRETHVRLFVT